MKRTMGLSGSGFSIPSWRFSTSVNLPVPLDLLSASVVMGGFMVYWASYKSTICALPVHSVFCLPALYSKLLGISNFEILKCLWKLQQRPCESRLVTGILDL